MQLALIIKAHHAPCPTERPPRAPPHRATPRAPAPGWSLTEYMNKTRFHNETKYMVNLIVFLCILDILSTE